MERSSVGKVEFVIILSIGLLIVLVAVAIPARGSGSERTGQVALPATPTIEPTATFKPSTLTPTIGPTSTLQPATSTPTTEPTATPTLVTAPGDIRYKTAEQAASYAIHIAEGYLKAENPQVVSVELLPLETAMQRARVTFGEDPGEAMAGLDPADAAEATWRVVLGGTRFYIPRCPAPLLEERENG